MGVRLFARTAYFRGSNNPDKGEGLNFMPSENGDETVKVAQRYTASGTVVPAHLPYLKPVNVRDVADNGHDSCKSVGFYRVEILDL